MDNQNLKIDFLVLIFLFQKLLLPYWQLGTARNRVRSACRQWNCNKIINKMENFILLVCQVRRDLTKRDQFLSPSPGNVALIASA